MLGFFGSSSGSGSGDQPGQQQQQPTASSDDDVRRKRLEKMAAASSSSSSGAGSKRKDSGDAIDAAGGGPSLLPPPPPSAGAVLPINETVSMDVVSEVGPASPTPNLPPPPPPASSTKAAAAPAASSSSSSSSASKSAATPSSTATTPSSADGGTPSGPTREALVLNLALESVFLFTLRPDGPTQSDSGHSILYVGTGQQSPRKSGGGGGGGGGNEFGSPSRAQLAKTSSEKLLTPDNIHALIPKRLEGSVDAHHGAVAYLAGAFKRICTKESTAQPATKAELLKCRKAIVTWTATVLATPELFGPNSQNAQADLFALLGDDASLGVFAAEVLKEVGDQEAMAEVGQALIQIFEAKLSSMPVHPVFSRLSSGRSAMDAVQPALSALAILCRDKRFARELSSSPAFALPSTQSIFTAAPPPIQFWGFAPVARGGNALERSTLLGRILAFSAELGDPSVNSLFRDGLPTTRQQEATLETNVSFVRGRLHMTQVAAAEIVTNLLKAAGPTKEATMLWLAQSLEENKEHTKTQPNPTISSSPFFMLNVSSLFLHLCKPFMGQEDKLKKVDWKYLLSAETQRVFPRGSSMLVDEEASGLAEALAASLPPDADINFMTKAFFLCWRSLEMGAAKLFDELKMLERSLNYHWEDLQNGAPHALNEFSLQCVLQAALLGPALLQNIVAFCCAASSVLVSALEGDGSEPTSEAESVLLLSAATDTQKAVLAAIPTEFVETLFSLLLGVAKKRPDELNAGGLESVLRLLLFLLRRPWTTPNVHLRSLLGKVLHSVFLPRLERANVEYMEQMSVDGPQTTLLSSVQACQVHMAPTLLLLYGAMEAMPFYDKVSCRHYISAVIRFLWSQSSHRPAFRRIVSASPAAEEAGGPSDFVIFANGVLNEINKQILEMQEKVSTIHNIRGLMMSAEWGARSEELKKQDKEKLHEAEQSLMHSAGLTQEVIGMVKFLSSDELIRKSFLVGELLKRFTSMLTSCLHNLTGSKGAMLDPADMQKLKYNPQTFLREVCQIVTHVAEFEVFCEATISDGYYNGGKPLLEALRIAAQFGLLPTAALSVLRCFASRCKAMSVENEGLNRLLESAPEEFLDPLTNELMLDPVRLPTSDNVMDRSSVQTQLLNNPIDPYNRKPLTIEEVLPEAALKGRILAWLAEQKARAKAMSAAAMAQSEAEAEAASTAAPAAAAPVLGGEA